MGRHTWFFKISLKFQNKEKSEPQKEGWFLPRPPKLGLYQQIRIKMVAEPDAVEHLIFAVYSVVISESLFGAEQTFFACSELAPSLCRFKRGPFCHYLTGSSGWRHRPQPGFPSGHHGCRWWGWGGNHGMRMVEDHWGVLIWAREDWH